MSGATRRIVLAADLPYFAGHFPGRPILPGVAQLAFVAAAAGGALVAVRALRFRRPVGPGDALDLSLDVNVGPDADPAEVRFGFTSGGAPVSSGVVVLGSGSGTIAAPSPHGPGAARADRDAAGLLPHEPPARLIASVGAASATGLAATALIPAASPFASGGRAPGFLALEIAAQAAAAFEALQRRTERGGEPAVGYLVGARDASFDGDLPVTVPLTVRIVVDALALPLARYSFDVAGSARGTISTYL